MLTATVLTAVAPPAQAVTYASTYLLIQWRGEGCVGTGTGTSISVVARDMFQASGTVTKSWPGTTSATRCKADSYNGLIQVGPVSLIKWDGYHRYRLEATITDATGSVTFYSASQDLRVGYSCTASTYYMGTNDVYCSSSQPASNYLGVVNQRPSVPTISQLYPDLPDPTTSLYLAWRGPSTQPSDFREWEVHMSKVSGFAPRYSFPTTLKATRTYASSYLSVTGLEPDTQYCFIVRHADRYWKHTDLTYRNYPSYADSAERCARTGTTALTVTSPNGGEIWSGTHPIAWIGGAPDFTVEVSSDNGASYTQLASGVASRSRSWDTTSWPDGGDYLVRVSDGSTSDASNARFMVDNTDPTTEATFEGATCNGWYSEAPLVTLTATDNLAGVRATRYDAGDGPRPYAGPFRLAREGGSSFRYWSEDRADQPNVETASSTTLRIDIQPPVTTLVPGAPNATSDRLYVNSSTDLALASVDAGSGVESIQYRIDGGEWTPYAAPFRLSGPDGERLVEFQARDKACHEEAIRSKIVFLDNTPAQVEIVEPRLVDPTPVTSIVPAGLPDLPVDPELLCEVATIVAKGLQDNGAPEAGDLVRTLLCASSVAVVRGNVTVRANATDPIVNGGASGVARVEFFVDGQARSVDASAPYEWTWNTSAEAPGEHTLEATAYDNLGQSSTTSVTVFVAGGTLDLCGPLAALPPSLAFLADLVRFALRELGLGCDVEIPDDPVPEPPAPPPVPPG